MTRPRGPAASAGARRGRAVRVEPVLHFPGDDARLHGVRRHGQLAPERHGARACSGKGSG